jgi:outer membrane protein assembly factor BamB
MRSQKSTAVRRGAVRGLALVALLALASVATSCGSSSTTTPTSTPSAGVTATPVGFDTLVVTNGIKGTGTVVQQTQVAAHDPATGHQIWARALMGSPGAFGPARAGNTVVASTGIQASPYPANQITALDIRTGANLWDHNFGPNTQAIVGATGATIIVVTSAVSIQASGAAQGLTVAALNPADGAQLWQKTLPNQEMGGAIRAADGAVYILGAQYIPAATSFTLTALSATTGAQLWQKALGTGSILGTVAANGAYYVGLYPAHLMAAVSGARTALLATSALSPFDASTLTAYRATDGAQLWQANGFAAPQTAVNGTLYATSAALDSGGPLAYTLLARNAATGARLWQSSKLGLGDPSNRPFAAADANGVYAFAMPETPPSVHALRAGTGAALWTALANLTVQAGVAGLGSVFTATVPITPSGQAPQPADVTVTALKAATGAVQWSLVVGRAGRRRCCWREGEAVRYQENWLRAPAFRHGDERRVAIRRCLTH